MSQKEAKKMANRTVRSTKPRNSRTKRETVQPKTGFSIRDEIIGLLIMAFAVVGLLGIFEVSVGIAGEILTGIFVYGFGLGAIIPCLFLLYVGWRILYEGEMVQLTFRGAVLTTFFLFLLALIPLLRVNEGEELLVSQLASQGGVVGGLLAWTFRALLGNTGAILITVVFLVSCVLLITRISLSQGLHKAKDKTAVGVDLAKGMAEEKIQVARNRISEWKEERETRAAYNQENDKRFTDSLDVDVPVEEAFEEETMEPVATLGAVVASNANVTEQVDTPSIKNEQDDASEAEPFDDIVDETEDDGIDALATVESTDDTSVIVEDEIDSDSEEVSTTEAEQGIDEEAYKSIQVPSLEGTEEDRAAVAVTTEEGVRTRRIERPYKFPSLDILAKGPVMTSGESSEVAHNAALLETTLKSFGITARVVNATQGPAVTRYELEPAPGTKVSRIVNLTDDLKLSLAAADIRMEAPIPGKSAIGIEVPNKSISAVHLRDVLDCKDFLQAKGGIPVGLGKDIAGKPIITDLAKMPHLLVAGSTGSGKSVCINTLISSVLFRRKPEEVKLILIDPKMVELSTYNGIPHLMTPVVTDMKKAASVLRWAVKEMEARYRTFATTGVRDIKRYNELHPKTAMPLVLIIIDELADLMMTAPADVEDSICRLAQMARAAGLHMVLATQRPSVNVITGTIKANVPSRISFAVATQIDSRTILDMAGAEKLLGKGDMLFNPIGANKPIRIQGAFISDDEVEELVSFIKQQGQPEYDETVVAEVEASANQEANREEEVIYDELLERAVDLVMDSGQASVSMLQRRFRIGYTRAARLVDTMEELKIVGPNMGSKARDILMTQTEAKEKYFSKASEE